VVVKGKRSIGTDSGAVLLSEDQEGETFYQRAGGIGNGGDESPWSMRVKVRKKLGNASKKKDERKGPKSSGPQVKGRGENLRKRHRGPSKGELPRPSS